MSVFESKPQMFWRKLREGFGKFFGAIGRLFQRAGQRIRRWWSAATPGGRGALIGGLLVMMTVLVGALVLLRPELRIREYIVIGDTTITRDDIERQADDLEQHIRLNPSIVVDDIRQTAIDDLVMHAALMMYNETTCRVEVTAQDLMRAFGRGELSESDAEAMIDSVIGPPGSFMRIRMENVVYRQRMEDCLIGQREILYLGVHVTSFYDRDDQPVMGLYEDAKRMLREQYVPLLERDWSADEIIQHIHANREAGDADGNELEPFDISQVISGVITCTEEIGGCLIENDIAAEYAANFGSVYRIWDQAARLGHIGEVSDIFLSTAGLLNVIRLEDMSGEGYISWGHFLESIKERYAYTRTSMVLNHIGVSAREVAQRMGLVPIDVHASGAIEHYHRRSSVWGGSGCENYTMARCNGHPLTLHLRAETVSGFTLRGWEYNPRLRNGCCATALDSPVGIPAGSSASFVRILHNCDGPGPAPNDVFPARMVRHPEGYEDFPLDLLSSLTPTETQAAIVHRIAHTDPEQPVPDVTAGPMRWIHPSEPNWLNRHQSVTQLFIYPELMGWESEGQTMILSPTAGWTKDHPEDTPMEVDPGNTVQWRHRVDISGDTGSDSLDLSVTTVQSDGVSGANAVWSEHNISAARAEAITPTTLSTGWQQRTWQVPMDAAPGTVFCQHWTWRPNATDDNSMGSSVDDLRQCVRVRDDGGGCPILVGTTTLNGSNVDVQVAAGAPVVWAHTLTRPAGGAVFNNVTITFQQIRTEGDNYSPALQTTGSWTGNVTAAVLNVPLGATANFTVNPPIEEGQTLCQALAWQVEGHPECNGQTSRVCATTSVTGSEEEFVSRVRSCSIRTRSLAGNTVEHCTPWVDLNNTPQSAQTHFAKTRDNIRLRHEAQKIAQHESRQSRNYIPLPAFNVARTRCATNPDQARNCTALGPNLTYTPPTSPGQTAGVVLNPSWLSPAMEPWNVAPDGCALSPISLSIPDVAPANCTSSDAQLQAGSNFAYEGTGRVVRNSDLGTVEADLTQRITLGAGSVRIIVHRNNDTHTISYRYARRRTGTCAGTNFCPPCGLFGCAPGCPSSTRVWHGTRAAGNAVTGNCCGAGCSGPSHGGLYAQDSTGTYTENQHTWIEVTNDGPISAEASFAIPYNYDILPVMDFAPANAHRIQPGGTELGFRPRFEVTPRFNEQVGETYATATRPGTRWQVMEFYLPPNASDPGWGTGGGEMTFNGMSLGCSAFHNQAFGCRIEGRTESLNTQSENSDHNLRWGSTFWPMGQSLTPRMVGDLEIGTKFCVSAAVMDYSSHNGATGWVSGNGYTHMVRGEWKATTPTCVAIGKQPMVNVIGDGLYSDGEIVGTTFEKAPGAQICPSTGPCPVPEWGAFGSWAEYAVVSNAAIRNFASGAALGAGAGGVPLGGSNATTMAPRNTLVGSCSIATLTFRNTGCPPMLGLNFPLGHMAGARDLQAYGRARDIRHRYSNVDNPTIVSGSVTLGGSPDRITHLRSNGGLTINTSTIGVGRTVIVDSTGPVTIAGNISLYDGSYTDVSQIPQVLIFAPSININPIVTRVDAWLLAGLNGGSGTINTCTGVQPIDFETNAVNSNTCPNPLRINGPVMASRVWLHRTAGAGVGMPASARPAETFFLSPATFLWAHNQAELLRSVFLSYAREVAPRF